MNEISPPERSLSGLFTELTRETATLFRQEIQLAKVELAEKARQAGSGAVITGVGAAFLFIGIQAVVAAAILGLAKVLDDWLAAWVVGCVVLLAGAGLLARGLANLKRDNLTPKRTIDTLRATTRWARDPSPKEEMP